MAKNPTTKPAPELVTIRVLSPIFNGELHQPGAEIEVPAAEAAALIAATAAELVAAAE